MSVSFWDTLKPSTEYVSKEIYSKRYSICKSCDNFISSIKVCNQCGCFMKIKCALKEAYCPIGKWNKENNGNNL